MRTAFSELGDALRLDTDRFHASGKEVLDRDLHVADASTELMASMIAAALNKMPVSDFQRVMRENTERWG